MKNLSDLSYQFSKEGGAIAQLEIGGRQIFFPQFQKGDGKSRGGMFLCFPYFGEEPSSMEGLGRHGFFRNHEFEDLKFNSNSTFQEFRFEFSSWRHPFLAKYPWIVRCHLSYRFFYDGMVEIEVRVKRGCDMNFNRAPINIGLHPYFPAGKFGIGKFRHNCSGNFFLKKLGGYGDEEKIFIDCPKHRISMKLEGFGYLGLWSDSPREYICIEPIAGDPADFNTPRGVFLDEGKEKTYRMKLIILGKECL